MTQSHRGFRGRRADHGNCAGSFVVETEVLGKGTGHEEVAAGCGELLDTSTVCLDAGAKALVGEVRETKPSLVGGQRSDFGPLLVEQIDPSLGLWQQPCSSTTVSGGNLGERLDHLLVVQTFGLAVIVRIAFYLEACGSENAVMVGPR